MTMKKFIRLAEMVDAKNQYTCHLVQDKLGYARRSKYRDIFAPSRSEEEAFDDYIRDCWWSHVSGYGGIVPGWEKAQQARVYALLLAAVAWEDLDLSHGTRA